MNVETPAGRVRRPAPEVIVKGAPVLVVQDGDREAIADALAELLVAALEAEGEVSWTPVGSGVGILAREARGIVETSLDASGWLWSRRLSRWLDCLIVIEEEHSA